MKIIILFLLVITMTVFAQGEKNVAKVSMLKGQAFIKSADGKVRPLKMDEWVSQGDIVQTKEKTIVKLIFTDKSTMNVGPSSEVNINKFGGGEAGLISVMSGQIRSQVTKDLLKQEQDKSKLIIKTKTAAMGIRGTDFLVSYSEESGRTNLITFEGNVAMAQIESHEAPIIDVNQLESIVSDPQRAVAVTDGLFAGAAPNQEHVTIPTKISPVQFENLKENDTFESKSKDENSQTFNSVIPPGLSAKIVANDQEVPKDQSVPVEKSGNLPPPEGMVDSKTGAVAPPAGGLVDLKTGIYVAPPPGAKFDANAGVYIVPTTMGTVDSKGDYKAPEGLKLSTEGTFVPVNNEKSGAGSTDSNSSTKATDKAVAPPPPPMILSAGMKPISPDAVMRIDGHMGPNQGKTNDVLGGGFFIPGNYFIDNRDTSVLPNLNNPTDTKVKFNIQAQ